MNYTLYLLSSFALALIFTPLVRWFALKNNLIAHPRVDRWHNKPTALLGGISVYLSVLIPVLVFRIIDKSFSGLLFGATLLFVVGLFDEKFHFRPYTKLVGQIIAACAAILSGIIINFSADNSLNILITIFWIIAITNSFNLLDNIDGLATGIAAISSLMLFFSFLFFSGNNPLSIFCLILCGASLGFLPYNFNPAKIFMGDSGSMFLGYSLAVLSIGGASRHVSSLFITMIVPVLILSVPIFDTIFVMVIRTIKGKMIFEGGKDHTSHQLVTLGLSQKKTVLLLYSISIVFGLIALSYSRLNIFIISIITLLAVTILLLFGFFIFELISYGSGARPQKKENTALKENAVLNNILLHKRRIVEVLLDLIFICLAYYSAYLLRFEGALLLPNLQLMKESLVWIVLINISIFFISGLYRGVWRYISIADFFTIFKAVTLSCVTSVLFLTFAFRFKEYSRAVFFINWLLLLFLITGSRFMFRIFGEFFSGIQKPGKNILIFGAGDMGEMVLREIKRNRKVNYNPVGFIDDNPLKFGSKIHGIAVLGTKDDLEDIIYKERVEEIIIAISSIPADDFLEIGQVCKKCGISYKRVCGILDNGIFTDNFNEI